MERVAASPWLNDVEHLKREIRPASAEVILVAADAVSSGSWSAVSTRATVACGRSSWLAIGTFDDPAGRRKALERIWKISSTMETPSTSPAIRPMWTRRQLFQSNRFLVAGTLVMHNFSPHGWNRGP